MLERASPDRMGAVILAAFVAGLAVARCAAPADAAPRRDCGCELERRRLYLDCMHAYSLGAVLGPDGQPADAAMACRELAGLPAADLPR